MASMFIHLPWDITASIMCDLIDLQTLRNLILAVPYLATPLSSYFTTITKDILTESFADPLLTQFLHAIIAARSLCPRGTKELQSFFAYYFPSDGETRSLPRCVIRDPTSLEYMVRVLNAVEFYLAYAVRVWGSVRVFHTPLFCKNSPPVSYTPASDSWSDPPTWTRMRRALLRIQLYTELFHQPGDASLTNEPDEWETQNSEIKSFWGRYDLVEMRECKCIYIAIALSVGHETYYKKPLTQTKEQDKLHLRGLPQLQKFMQGNSYTEFGMWYLNRLLEKKMHGFDHVDPRDDARSYHMVLDRIFHWGDGPHGGLGKMLRRREYVYSSYFVDVPFYRLFGFKSPLPDGESSSDESSIIGARPLPYNRLEPLPGQSW